MTNLEYAKYKGKNDFKEFVETEGYPTPVALDQFREDVYGFMVEAIGNTQARSEYDATTQYRLRNIEYRGVELMISGEIAKAKIENYIKNAIAAIFSPEDKADLEIADDEIHRGVV